MTTFTKGELIFIADIGIVRNDDAKDLAKFALGKVDELEDAEYQRENIQRVNCGLFEKLTAAEKRIAELEAREPDLYLCRVTRNGEELYSPCGKDYPRGRGYIAAGIITKVEE